MTKAIVFILGGVLLVPGFASAQQTLQVVRVNTDDAAAYLAWAEEAAPVLLAENQGAVGACVPRFGAEDQGDIYYFTVSPNMEALLSLDLNAPSVQREVAKVADVRTVVSRDVYTGLRVGPLGEAGSRWAQASLFVETAQVGRYIELLGEQELALHENGFDDVSWSAYGISTGMSSGLVLSNLQAPTGPRLGAALDAVMSASWSNFARGEFNDVRTLVQTIIFDCAIYAANP